MQAWSSGVGCIGWGYVGFSRGALGFGHEQATSMGRSAGHMCCVIARLMPCRTVCGASEMDASFKEEKANMIEGDACKLRDSSGQFIGRLVQALLCDQQRGTCTQHNQVLCSQLAMRLSISPVCLKQRV
jgi:hypothetical protein